MAVKLKDMMKKSFTPKEQPMIRRDAKVIAKRHMALRVRTRRAEQIGTPKKSAT